MPPSARLKVPQDPVYHRQDLLPSMHGLCNGLGCHQRHADDPRVVFLVAPPVAHGPVLAYHLVSHHATGHVVKDLSERPPLRRVAGGSPAYGSDRERVTSPTTSRAKP